MNVHRDESLAQRAPQVYDKMCELNDRSGGRLFSLREQSLQIWRGKLAALSKLPAYAELFDAGVQSKPKDPLIAE